MKKLLTILTLLTGAGAFAQSLPVYKDTVMAGMTARIRPGTDGLIIGMPGLGELGNGTLANDTICHSGDCYITGYLAEYWIAHGWNRTITIGNGVHHPTIVTLIQSSAISSAGNTQPPNIKLWMDALMASRFAPATGLKNVIWVGFSAGGNVGLHMVEHQPEPGDTSYYKYITALIDLQGVKPDDQFGSTLPYPRGFGHRMKIKPFTYIGVEGTFDESRDIWTRRDNMIDSLPGHAYGMWTDTSGGTHCCWSAHVDPSRTNFSPTSTIYLATHDGDTSNFTPAGQNLWQVAFRGGDTTFPSGSTPPTCTAGPPGQVQLPATTITLTGTATPASGSTISSTAWTVLVNPGGSPVITSPSSLTTGITGLNRWGNYVFRLIVTDNHGLKDTATVRVNVLPVCNLSSPVTYTLSTTSTNVIDLDAGTQPWRGGDTVNIPSGNYNSIAIYNFTGDACHSIIIRPVGTVNCTYFSINKHTQYARITGINNLGVPYSLKLSIGNTAACFEGHLFNHIEVDHIEIDSTLPGSAGMFMKTTADTSVPETLYPNYQSTWLYLHHIIINKSGNESMYIGHTSPFGTDAGQGPWIPIRLDSVEIAFCVIDLAGWDAIQLSGALDGCKIHDNTITRWGRYNQSSQQAGIILGAATRGDVYNNNLRNGTGNALQFFNYGISNAFNNVIDSAGRDGTTNGQESILSNDQISNVETFPGQQVVFFQNQIKHPQVNRAVIHFYNETGSSLAGNIHDNVFCIPGANPATFLTTYITTSPAAALANNSLIFDCSPIINGPTKTAMGLSRRISVKH